MNMSDTHQSASDARPDPGLRGNVRRFGKIVRSRGKVGWWSALCLGVGALYLVGRSWASGPSPGSQAFALEVEAPPPSGFQRVFSDEFEGTELNRDVWCTRLIFPGGKKPQHRDPECQSRGGGTMDHLNDEKQRYVDENRDGKPLHVVRDGVLYLRATKTGEGKHPYESAMIRSKRLFLPSATKELYITARVRLPSVRGTWPAFWLNSDRASDGSLGWPPEIDIFEAPLNDKDDRANMLHIGAISRGVQKRAITYTHDDFSSRRKNLVAGASLRMRWIHTAILWTEGRVCYLVNGIRVMCEDYEWVRRDGSAAPPAHLLLNLAIGGQWAGRYGIEDERFPTEFAVDHVRVYERQVARATETKPTETKP